MKIFVLADWTDSISQFIVYLCLVDIHNLCCKRTRDLPPDVYSGACFENRKCKLKASRRLTFTKVAGTIDLTFDWCQHYWKCPQRSKSRRSTCSRVERARMLASIDSSELCNVFAFSCSSVFSVATFSVHLLRHRSGSFSQVFSLN